MKEQQMAQDNLILKCIVGSHLYGTNTPNSDKDYVGVFIPDKEYVLGLQKCEQVDIRTNPADSGRRNGKDDSDTTVYSLPKFIKLAADNNPNIVALFFVDKPHILYCNDYGKRLLEAFPYFISKRVKHKFLGYAHSQRQKILTKNPIGNRKEYIEKYGYDVKFASHLIRLLSEGLNLLVDGKLSFPVDHNRYIRDIKEGKYDMGQVLSKADELESFVEQAYLNTKLPYGPDLKKIEDLQMEMLEEFWQQQLDNHFYEATKRLGW